MKPATTDNELLRMAILGHRISIDRIEKRLAAEGAAAAPVKRSYQHRAPKAAAKAAGPGGKRRISPEGRARIAEAQRKRWAASKAAAA